MSYWATGSISFTQDAPKDVSRLVTSANVIEGNINYQGFGLHSKHTVVIVSWNDPDDLGRISYEIVEDPKGIRLRGWRPIEVAGFGCTSRGQARRLGKWILDSEKSEDEMVTYIAGMDHYDAVPGEIVEIADPIKAGVRMGGRIVAVTDDSVTLDAPYTVNIGDSLNVITEDTKTIEELGLVSNVDETRILVTGSTDNIRPGAIYVLVSLSVNPVQWRIITIEKKDDINFTITAVKYDADKFVRVEEGIQFDELPVSLLPTGNLAAPTDLSYLENLYKANNKVRTRVSLSCTPSTDPRALLYKFEALPPDGIWYDVQTSQSTSVSVEDAEFGKWKFAVTALTSNSEDSLQSPRVETDEVVIFGKSAPPGDIENLSSSRDVNGVELHWDKVNDIDLVGYDIRRGTSWENYDEIIAEGHISNRIYILLDTADDVTFLIRSRDELNIYSINIASITTSASNPPAPTNFRATQDGSYIRFDFDESPGIGNTYEIRQGADSWTRSVVIGRTTATGSNFIVPTTTTQTITFRIRAYSALGKISDETLTTLTIFPIFTGVQTVAFHPLWEGDKNNLVVDSLSGTLSLDSNETLGTYRAEVTLNAEVTGTVWLEFASIALSANPLLINDANHRIFDANEQITPASNVEVQISFEIEPTDPVSSRRAFQPGTYQIRTAYLHVTLQRSSLDDDIPALTTLNFNIKDQRI